MSTTAILLAGGKGERLGGDTPKQFLELAGKPLFWHSLDVFEGSPFVDAVVLVVPSGAFDWPPLNQDEVNQDERFPKVFAVITGGETRQGSVAQGMANLPEGTEIVLVHDAARPLLEGGLIESLLSQLNAACEGAIPAIPLEDAIKRVASDGFVEAEVDRREIWRVQTPQAFWREPLEESLRAAQGLAIDAPDCSHMLTRAGYRVKIVQGDPLNLKVTRPADFHLAEMILHGRQPAIRGGDS